jgi:hypothetical protein
MASDMAESLTSPRDLNSQSYASHVMISSGSESETIRQNFYKARLLLSHAEVHHSGMHLDGGFYELKYSHMPFPI